MKLKESNRQANNRIYSLSSEFIGLKNNYNNIFDSNSIIENQIKNDKEVIIDLKNDIINLNKNIEILTIENKNINNKLNDFIVKNDKLENIKIPSLNNN